MKIKNIKLALCLIIYFPNQNLTCASRSKPKVKKNKRDLILENEQLRHRLAQLSPISSFHLDEFKKTEPDLEKGEGTGFELTRTTSLRSSPSLRRRASSTFSDESNITELLDAHQSQFKQQAAIHETIGHILQKQVEFQDSQRKYDRNTRKIGVISTIVAVTYTSIGFVWQNWDYFSNVFGHSASNSTSSGTGSGTGTNSTGT